MKTLFIPTLLKETFQVNKTILKKLPSKISIFYSIQFKKQAEKIKSVFGSRRITKFSQILGCSNATIPPLTKSILVISSGKFHALSIAKNTNLPVFVLENNQLLKILPEEIAQIKRNQKISYTNFLNADKIGILISTKLGQENLEKSLKIKSLLKKPSYLYIADEIKTSEFENFPQIKSWVNTACPRLENDSSLIINFEQLNICNAKNCF